MAELFLRSSRNPLLSADDWPYPVNAVFNPGATIMDGETVLLCRVEDRRGLSHLTVARSANGVDGWRIDAKPLITGDPDRLHSRWGVEDPRITRMEELGGWVIAYTAYGPEGPCVALAITQDFRETEPIGVVMTPEDKNASLLSRHVDGHFILFHRPHSHQSGRADVWLSRSESLRSWTAPEPVFGAREGLAGLNTRGNRLTATGNALRVARGVPRGQGDGRRPNLPGRSGTARSGQPGKGVAAHH